jgi:site-specific DNA recombinase
VYTRISRDPTGAELGVRRQDKDCRALCEREGWEIAAAFVDDDRSAYSGKPRPGYRALCDLLAADAADVLVAWHPDRLTRHPRELEDLIDLLEQTRTTVRTCQTGEYDLATPSGRTTARIVGAVARGESEHKSARLRRKHLELAENGALSGGGYRPFGYERDRVTIRPGEAEIVREIAGRVLAGESLHAIAANLNARGLSTTTGAKWKPQPLRRILLSPRIAGLRGHRGEIAATAVWPAIITQADHRRIVAILTDPARTKNNGRQRRLLTGLLVCGRCGARMVSRPRGDGSPCYVCAKAPGDGCGGIRVLGEPLDDLVTAAALIYLDSPALADALAERHGNDKTLGELADVDARLAELGELWAAGDIDRSGWKAARDALERRRADLQADVRTDTAGTAVEALAGEAAIDWPNLAHGRRRAILAALINSVTIGPAVRGRNRFDPDRVTISWK